MINSKLFKLVHEDVTAILRNMDPKEINSISLNISNGKKPNKRNLQHYYIEPIFIELMKINESFERCKLCAKFLKKESKKKQTTDNVIKFYFSYYHIIIASIYDNVFRLINRILFTGLSPKDINSQNTKNNIFIKGSEIEKSVIAFYKLIQKCLEYRNEIIHENIYNFVYDYFNPAVYQYFEVKEIEGMKTEFSEFFKFLDLQMKREIKNVVNNISDDISKYNIAVVRILDSLYLLYLNNIQRKINLVKS